MRPEDQAAANQGACRYTTHAISLAVAALLWLLVDGFCAVRLLSLQGPGRGWMDAVLVIGLPLLATLAWWLALRRLSVRLTGRSGSAVAGRGLDNGLMMVAVVLALAAVWMGQTHVRTIRSLSTDLAARESGQVLASGAFAQAVRAYRALAIGGGLLQLAVVTLGVAFSRRVEPGSDQTETGTEG